jgi:hypothetical protein
VRYVNGQYRRDLPRAVTIPGDVFVSETWYGPKESVYYVCDAFESITAPESVRVSAGFDTRRSAVEEAWRLLARQGRGRLLQGGHEVPIRWSLSFRHDAPPDCRERYGRKTTGERHLATALRRWAELPGRVSLYMARAVVAKGYQGATFPLTQTETRAALRFDPDTLRPLAREAFQLLDLTPSVIPDVLRVQRDSDLAATHWFGGPSWSQTRGTMSPA